MQDKVMNSSGTFANIFLLKKENLSFSWKLYRHITIYLGIKMTRTFCWNKIDWRIISNLYNYFPPVNEEFLKEKKIVQIQRKQFETYQILCQFYFLAHLISADECIGKANGVYEVGCRSYVVCHNQHGTIHNCPDPPATNTVFNSNTKTCDE